ncbi:class I SAM-dependent methyltransferase [Herbidospora mongoliensis]|uniref:class I SAM-dependent methyltransferase n=1 Tax=Herbidospora mongoliensis TaxID=688067 RepID=UPI0008351360|nr:class I SAM-dependent methyltransferase [Herbidospora mongoliensis]
MPWYTDFFTELPNTFWRAAVPSESTKAEIDFLMTLPGDHVLDVACGSGRHALELAARGRRVTGVDVSAEAIAHATGEAARRGLTAAFHVGDMRALPATIADTAICMGNAFGYLDHDETRAFLAGLTARTVVLDYGFAAESFLPGVALEEEPLTIGGVTAEQVNEYDVARSRWITHFTFTRGEEVHRGTSVQHVYTAAEVCRMVTEAGFGTIDLYGDPDGAPYELRSPRLILVARR